MATASPGSERAASPQQAAGRHHSPIASDDEDDDDDTNGEETDDTSDDEEDSEQSQQDEQDEAPGSRPVNTSSQAGETGASREEVPDSDSKAISEDAIDSLDPKRLKRSLKFAIGRMEMMMKQTQEVR